MRSSQYVSSVPLLTRQWMVEGYIWQISGALEKAPEGTQFIAVLPDNRTLVATVEPQFSQPPESLQAQNSQNSLFTPWPVEIYSDSNLKTPLAILDSLGHYAQIESFSIPLEQGDNSNEVPSPPQPAFCRFLCGQTTGELHICPD